MTKSKVSGDMLVQSLHFWTIASDTTGPISVHFPSTFHPPCLVNYNKLDEIDGGYFIPMIHIHLLAIHPLNVETKPQKTL